MLKKRKQKHEKELREKYLQLYQNEQCYEELIQSMEEAFQNRPAELKRLDSRREKEPDWYRSKNMLGMTMYPKLFAGGLKGVIEHLDYLSEQKITYLHLMPLLKMPHPYNDGGYAVEDFKEVDPEIGTNKELAKLTKELRKQGMSLCLDVVMNHTADTHEWAMRAKRGEQEYMDRYQCYETREIPDQFEKTMPQVFPETAPGNFTWCEEMQRYVLTTFYPYQWDLNYHNPKVFNEMIDNILYLANLGVEVFRIDAVPYIWKELGTNCRNLPQVHSIVRMLRMILEMVCPGGILKGEVVMAPKELPIYFGTEEAPECHMLYAEKRKEEGTVQYQIWNGLKQLEELRCENECFGETAEISTWDTGNNAVFAIRRATEKEEMICLANFSGEGQNAWLNCLEGEYEDLFTGEKLEMNSVWMNPYQYRWCVKK